MKHKSQISIFQERPRYVIDTNVIVSFLKQTEDEFYGKDIFQEQWQLIEGLIQRGIILSTLEVKSELEKYCPPNKNPISEMKQWLKDHDYMFQDVLSNEQLEIAKKITSKYEIYGESQNYLGDLSVISLAGALDITAISLESEQPVNSLKRPKIPNTAKEYNVKHVSFSGFLRLEQAKPNV